MSGGVDSSVTAALLKKEGYDVTGVHMICAGPPIGGGCENGTDRRDAMKVAAVLDIPFLTWDFRDEYKKEVYDYMISEYIAGRTPNPDIMCNSRIKFGCFLERALGLGADYIATGHYIKKENSKLKIAKDLNKDQSYFLWTLTQNQLKHCLFPVGDYLKSDVRELAKKFKLSTSEKKDSQGLCFIGKVDFQDFLKEKIPAHIGDILDFSGKKIGTHEGALFYTIGQRHGLNLGGQENPIYVAKKDVVANTITVVKEKDENLYKSEIKICNANWINRPSQDKIFARIRYRQPLQNCVIRKFAQDLLYVDFAIPQRAVASGQSIVFYSAKGEMLGGGIIV